MSLRSVIDTVTSDASTGIQTRYTERDWQLISIFSAMGSSSARLLITRRSGTSGNRLEGRGAGGLEMVTTTRWRMVG